MKKVLAGLLSLAFAGVIAGCGGSGDKAADKPAEKKAEEKIVIGLDDNFPPMGFHDESNEIVGFDIDLAKELSKRLGTPVEFKAIDWASKEAEIASGRIDAIWNGLEITEERKKNLLFSEPYMNNRLLIFRRAKDDSIRSEADLAGKAVATQSGSSTAEDYVDGNASKFSSTKKYPEYLSAFMDLEAGRIDAVICDEIIGRYYMSKHPDTMEAVDGNVGPVTQYGVAYKKENKELRDKFQKVLDEMRADGTMAKISEKWFGKDITKL
ncbi:amino acid ABC transporter substrate-binding protein [Selenomonas sp. TAMA-11512]|uniref:amino acid ABC transporter substrate-binding protein n=1 Tax=Selenomonas sp. TAMA-11512 TaxID=3095337 RepID=UPI0030D2A8C3